jgi:hypothetical protein
VTRLVEAREMAVAGWAAAEVKEMAVAVARARAEEAVGAD